jgi:hypothetical protein
VSRFAWFIIIGLVLLYFISNYLWVRNTAELPAFYEELLHYEQMFQWEKAFLDRDFHELLSLFSDALMYEPFYYLPAVCLHSFGLLHYHADVLLNVLFFFFLIIFIYLLASHLFNKNVGLVSVLLISLYPGVYGLSRHYYIDFALLPVITGTFYFLIRTDFFCNTKFSFFTGLSIGIGLLTKMPYVLFVFPYLLFYMVYALYIGVKKKQIGTIVRNIFCVVLISSILAGYRYFRFSVLNFGFMVYFSEARNDSIFFYLNGFKDAVLSVPFFLVAVIAFIWCLMCAKPFIKLLMLLWFVPALLYFSTMLHWKDIRYIMPLLPCCALVSAAFLCSLKHKIIRNAIVVLLLCFGFYQFSFITFGSFSHDTNKRISDICWFFFRLPNDQSFINEISAHLSEYEDDYLREQSVLFCVVPDENDPNSIEPTYYSFEFFELVNQVFMRPFRFQRAQTMIDDPMQIVSLIAQSDLILSTHELSSPSEIEKYILFLLVEASLRRMAISDDVDYDTLYEYIKNSRIVTTIVDEFCREFASFMLDKQYMYDDTIFIYKRK